MLETRRAAHRRRRSGMLDPRRLAGLGLVVLVTAVLGHAVTSAAEPGLSDLNGQSFWRQFENGFRGLEQAALSQATRLQHALQHAMHLEGRQPPDASDAKTAKADADAAAAGPARPADAEGADAAAELSEEDSSASMAGVELHGMFPAVGGAEGEEEEDSSEEETDSSPLGPLGPLGPFQGPFPGPLAFPDIFGDPFSVVWWKGPNVCVAREEFDETPEPAPSQAKRRQGQDADADLSESAEDSASASPEDHGPVGHHGHPLLEFMGGPMFSNFHFSTCSQTTTKYQCVTKSINHGVHKKLVTTHRCCHGARREPGKPGCTLVEMASLLDTARDAGGALFAKMLSSAGLDDMVALGGNSTLFVPTDDAMRDFMDGIQEQNRVRRALGPRPLTPVLVADEESSGPEAPARTPVQPEPLPEALPVAQEPQEQDDQDQSSEATPAETEAPDTAEPAEPAEPARGENKLPAADTEPRRSRVDKDPLASELVDLDDRTLVLAHRVDGLVDLQEARNDQLLNTTAGTSIRLNVYAGPTGRTVTANCARVSRDRPAVGGLVHQVDQVLRPVPAERTLASLIQRDPRLSTMRAILQVSGLMPLLQQAGPLTVFFPTDEAFRDMDAHSRLALLKGEGCVDSFVRNLMVKHTVCTAAAALRVRAPNMDGEYLLLERAASDDGKLFLEDAELGAHDIMAANGVLHLLNKVIVPDSAKPVRDVLKSRNLTRWYDLLEEAGLLDEVGHARNMTLFVPTRAALDTPEAELLLSQTKEEVRDLLRYHMGQYKLEADDMSNGQMLDSHASGRPLRINLYSTIPFLGSAVTSATVQCGRLESVNNQACGAVLHEVDRVLAPPTEPVLGLLQRDEFSTLRDIVKASSYVEYLSATKEFPPFTLLAPSNAAFEENVGAERLAQLKSDKKHADAFLQRHILPTSLCCSGVGVSSWLFTNRVPTLKEGISHRIRKDSHNHVRIGDAVIQQCDKIATNGIMHVIDTPLIPTKALVQTPLSNRRRNSNLEILLFGL